MVTIQLDLSTLAIWILVGLVAGFLASHAMLGHGMGILMDILVGIVGALLGGFLSSYFGVHLTISGQPMLSEILIAFFGAMILLLVMRLVGFGRHRRLVA